MCDGSPRDKKDKVEEGTRPVIPTSALRVHRLPEIVSLLPVHALNALEGNFNK